MIASEGRVRESDVVDATRSNQLGGVIVSGNHRVAYLVKRFPRLSETFVLNEVLELKRQGIDLLLYALMDPEEALVDPQAGDLAANVQYLHDVRDRLRSWLVLLAGSLAQAGACPTGALRVVACWLRHHRSRASLRHAVEGLWLARDLRRRAITHLHAHFAHSPAAVAHMARLAGGPPFSFTAHAKDLYTTPARHIRERARAAEFVLTCTGANRRYLASLSYETATEVIYHGTDTDRFHPCGRHPQPGRILSVGRLVPKKGFDCLIDALGGLKAVGVPFDCRIVGGGPLHGRLWERIVKIGLEDRVQILGARLQEELVAEYQHAALFVLAPVQTEDGDRDGIPNVLVEAMACGVPVISTRLSGIPELIEHAKEGLLVEPGDHEGLAQAIRRVLDDRSLALSLAAAGRSKVERLFDVRRNAEEVASLFTPSSLEAKDREVVLAR